MASIPTDPYELLHWNMELAHSTYEKGYENIVSLLDEPPLDDLKNFLGYCEAWAHSILHHHDTEEATVFPILNKRMEFSHEQDQHKKLHEFLERFLELVTAARADATRFSGIRLKQLMMSAKDMMSDHFSEELMHIEASKLREANFTAAECKNMVDAMEKHAKANGDPFVVVPFMRSHTAPEFKDIWPQMPWILRKVVVPFMLAKFHSGYWKYSPYAVS
ncbi:hypothetical protein BC628DRAFT_1319755 [Trametes gibbosa]|nr:hypothetical protein BC628DRAFT_1319755 [Trametes gibbosa]